MRDGERKPNRRNTRIFTEVPQLFNEIFDYLNTMGYHPRIESKEYASFLTTRSRNSALWFINNEPLENVILGYAAKYTKRYKVVLYGLAIEGNHIQGPAHFPEMNRSHFMRDLNSSIARAVTIYTPEYEGGRFWGKRYSSEFLPHPEDIEEYVFYTALQPIQDGLVEKISEYPGYNFFHDAVWGIKREFQVVHWGKYNDAKRFTKKTAIKDYIETVYLEYARVPGYEHLSRKEYADMMYKKLEDRRVKIVSERKAQGLGFYGKNNIRKTPRGSLPQSTKTSDITSHRPRVLSKCPERRAHCKAWYFSVYFEYKEASRQYRGGNYTITFPEGTYKPFIPPLVQ